MVLISLVVKFLAFDVDASLVDVGDEIVFAVNDLAAVGRFSDVQISSPIVRITHSVRSSHVVWLIATGVMFAATYVV